MKIYILLFLLSFFIAGCSQTSIKNNNTSLSVTMLEASVIYVTSEKIILSKKHLPKDIVISLPTISGQIFGRPSNEKIYTKLIKEDQKINFNLNNSIETLEASSRALLQKWSGMGLKVSPADSKFSRIGTFAYNNLTGATIGAGGFIDPLTKNTLILMYVNKSCSIKGTFKLNNDSYKHDIYFPSSGFHFIKVKEVKKHNYKLEYYPKGGLINFSIHLNDMVST